MHRTLRSARPAAALALTLGVALVLPGAAFAGTTEPTPVSTTSTSSAPTSTAPTSTATTSTGTGSATTEPSGSTTSTTTTPTSGDTSTTPPPTGSTSTGTGTLPRATTTTAPERARTSAKIAALAAAVPESQAAANFIATTLAANADHYAYPGAPDFFDGGNTIDAILALDAIGTQSGQADASFAYLDEHAGEYIGTDYDSLYAGPTAKALLAALAHGANPHDVDGLDLVARLQAAGGAVTPGRFSDLPVDCGYPTCDYSNTIGQSLALIALARAGEPLSAASVNFLLDQQCVDGGFRGALEGAGCTSDPDATAFATQALVASGLALLCGTGAADLPTQAATALDRGLDHLEALQGGSGGLASSDGTLNANTTGVAAQAFYAGGRTTPGDAAAAFIVTLQYDATTPAALQGGIAYSASTRSTTTPSDTDLRATPQAALGLAGGSLVDAAAAGVEDAPAATACPAPPVTTTTTTTRPATSTTTTAAAPVPDDLGDPGSATPGNLAFTGADVAAATLLGTLLLLAGVGAIVLARRKGVHA